MKQGNGSDLLSASDPRSSTIGIIYVAPNDDRESVLTAILTQEKLGRKQIAIVLPNQNRAFQRPVDFEGLKNMKRKLQAQLIIVAPYGSSPAEFARQRRFTFFTSLDSYRKSLQEEGEASRATKRSWWGTRNPRPSVNDSPARNSEDVPTAVLPSPNGSQNRVPPAVGTADQAIHEQHAGPGVDAAALGLGLGAGALAADHFMPSAGGADAFDDDLALSAPPPQGSAPPGGGPTQEGMQAPPANRRPAEDETPDIITLPLTPRARDSSSKPVSPDGSEAQQKPVPVVVPAPTGRPNNAAGGPAIVTGTPGSGGIPPTRSNGGGGGGGRPSGQPRRGRLRWLLLALAALLLLSLLLCGGLALAAPGVLPGPLKNFMSGVVSNGTPSATVTITPKSVDERDTYVVTGITTGTPVSAKRQVQARFLTDTTQPVSKTVPATGVGHTAGARATGTLTFINTSAGPITIAPTVLTASNGVEVTWNGNITVPANPPTIAIPAFAVNVGANGNIPALAIAGTCCVSGNQISVKNLAAFTGGQDPQSFSIVQQRDVDSAANPLKGPLTQTATNALTAQKHANEQFVTQPQCAFTVNANPPAGTRANSVTVTVTAKCTAEVYDQKGAQTIAANLLRSKATKDTGSGYALTGNLVTTVTQATVTSSGTVVLFVKAEGIWVYQFSAAQKAALAQLIAGKTQSEAETLLLQQAGVGKVDSITLTSGTTLPTDVKQITIVVLPVSGLPAPTGTPGPGTPTFTTSPIPRPSPSTVPGK